MCSRIRLVIEFVICKGTELNVFLLHTAQDVIEFLERHYSSNKNIHASL